MAKIYSTKEVTRAELAMAFLALDSVAQRPDLGKLSWKIGLTMKNLDALYQRYSEERMVIIKGHAELDERGKIKFNQRTGEAEFEDDQSEELAKDLLRDLGSEVVLVTYVQMRLSELLDSPLPPAFFAGVAFMVDVDIVEDDDYEEEFPDSI